jgi:hypothetical protein
MGSIANCFVSPKSNPNPLAPPWLFPSEWLSETPTGYRDEFQMYTVTQVLTASQTVTFDLVTDSQGQCNFYWRAFGVFLFGGAGLPALRIRDSEGYIMSNTRIALANDSPFGRQDHVTPILVAHRMIPAAKMSFDFRETGGAAGVTVLLMLQGIKRWRVDPAFDGRGGSFGPTGPAPVNVMGAV